MEQYQSATGKVVSLEERRDVLTKARRAHKLLMDLTEHTILKIRRVTPTDLRKLKIGDCVQINYLIRKHLEELGDTDNTSD